MSEFGTVAVLMGGWSSERTISLDSGAAVLAALRAVEIDTLAYDVTPRTVASLIPVRYDRAFIAMHGRGGEDGSVQGMLEMLGVPYTGSGVCASAMAMNKIVTKQIWLAQRLPTPPFVVVDPSTSFADIVSRVALPFALKPACEGSSIGVYKVSTEEDFTRAKSALVPISETIFAETWIAGGEYAVALLADQILPPVHLQTPRPFYDYTAKYADHATRYHCPCDLRSAELHSLEKLCRQACHGLGVRGWGRVDVIRDHANQFWLLEVNTVPGLTTHSLVPRAAAAVGIDFTQLVLKILCTAASAAS